MTYAAYQESEDQGSPVELYHWTDGVETVRSTSAGQAVTDEDPPAEWVPAPISRTAPRQGGGGSGSDLEVKAPADYPAAAAFREGPPPRRWWLTLSAFHRTDPDLQRRVIFVGFVHEVARAGESTQRVIRLRRTRALLDIDGLRTQYQRPCNHHIYEAGCDVDPEPHTFEVTVESVDGVGILGGGFEAIPAGQLVTGIAQAPGGELRMIRAHTTGPGRIEVLFPFRSLAAGQILTVQRGCQHNPEICDSVFGNLPKYGGFLSIPTKNPFQDGIEV